jgi:hypothetical protein
MKKILKKLLVIFTKMGQARAAGMLSRSGRFDLAKNLYE